MPYNPAANPYTMNARELPSNPAAAAAVPRWNTIDPTTGIAYAAPANWASSPSATPNWGSMLVPPNVTTTPVPSLTSPVCTASATWPDALVTDRQATKIPTATGISPGTAVHAVATPVTIMGYGFTGATAVTIGGIACTAVVVVNDATITCTTPATSVAGIASVAVTTPAGTGTLTGAMTYT
jgi:hypothetical protein